MAILFIFIFNYYIMQNPFKNLFYATFNTKPIFADYSANNFLVDASNNSEVEYFSAGEAQGSNRMNGDKNQ